jgi:hypothetical protein
MPSGEARMSRHRIVGVLLALVLAAAALSCASASGQQGASGGARGGQMREVETSLGKLSVPSDCRIPEIQSRERLPMLLSALARQGPTINLVCWDEREQGVLIVNMGLFNVDVQKALALPRTPRGDLDPIVHLFEIPDSVPELLVQQALRDLRVRLVQEAAKGGPNWFISKAEREKAGEGAARLNVLLLNEDGSKRLRLRAIVARGQTSADLAVMLMGAVVSADPPSREWERAWRSVEENLTRNGGKK